ncbi:hypothetical protein BH09PAT4_BH09PAT4_00160 [soil metagenome]
MTKKIENLVVAKYGEWQASLWGACCIAFGFGVLLNEFFDGIWVWLIILTGVVLHAWGMQRTNKRNKTNNHGK